MAKVNDVERTAAQAVLFGHKTIAWLRTQVSSDRIDRVINAFSRLRAIEEEEKKRNFDRGVK